MLDAAPITVFDGTLASVITRDELLRLENDSVSAEDVSRLLIHCHERSAEFPLWIEPVYNCAMLSWLLVTAVAAAVVLIVHFFAAPPDR